MKLTDEVVELYADLLTELQNRLPGCDVDLVTDPNGSIGVDVTWPPGQERIWLRHVRLAPGLQPHFDIATNAVEPRVWLNRTVQAINARRLGDE